MVRVGTAFQVIFSCQVGANRLRRGLEAKGGGSGRKVGRVLGPVALGLLSDVLLLGNQIVNAFFVLNHL